jgi:hypothetical protein
MIKKNGPGPSIFPQVSRLGTCAWSKGAKAIRALGSTPYCLTRNSVPAYFVDQCRPRNAQTGSGARCTAYYPTTVLQYPQDLVPLAFRQGDGLCPNPHLNWQRGQLQYVAHGQDDRTFDYCDETPHRGRFPAIV